MIEFKAAVLDWAQSVSILACQRDAYGKIAFVGQPTEFTMKPHEPGSYLERGTFDVPYKSAQSLMNALWEAGLRPTEFKSPSGEINRLEAHLADMRKLVFDAPHGDRSGENNG